MNSKDAEIFLSILQKHKEANPDDILDNVERLIGYAVRGKKNSNRVDILMNITDSKEHTVKAWFNRSRKDVKIPVDKLCQIAVHFNVGIHTLICGKIEPERSFHYPNFSDIIESSMYHHGEWLYEKLYNAIGALSVEYLREVLGVDSCDEIKEMMRIVEEKNH